jgi:hypothetical protein
MAMTDDKPKTTLTYAEAMHAMQTGVANLSGNDLAPKHLRVGINSALVDNAALARLLVKKGVFTQEEYTEEVRLEMCREVDPCWVERLRRIEPERADDQSARLEVRRQVAYHSVCCWRRLRALVLVRSRHDFAHPECYSDDQKGRV